MVSEKKKEIRRALMGKTVPLEDGRLCVMTEGDYRVPLGVSDGAGSVLLFGIGRRAVQLDVRVKPGSARGFAREAMRHVGRELVLLEQPETVACIRRYRLTRPVVLTFLYAEDVPMLTAWTGRGPFSFISRRLAIRTFMKHVPMGISLAAKPAAEKAEKEGKKPSSKKGKGPQKGKKA